MTLVQDRLAADDRATGAATDIKAAHAFVLRYALPALGGTP
jgi:hypothetical protein